MNIERDKFITEAMGECWHIYTRISIGKPWVCWKCRYNLGRKGKPIFINNFSTWEGFGKLWEWSTTQDWHFDLVSELEATQCSYNHKWVNPNIFANAVFLYLKLKEK